MKLITIHIEVDDDAVVRSVTREQKRRGGRRKQKIVTPSGRYNYKSETPEAISETASGLMVRKFFTKSKGPVVTKTVGQLFTKKGLSAKTATPILSALVRTGHVIRIKPGVFCRAA